MDHRDFSKSPPCAEILARDIASQASQMVRLLERAPVDERHADAGEAHARAKAILAARRRRDAVLYDMEFGEPAWDMLLDLFIAGEEKRTVAITSLCIAAAVPPTTALRWVGAMVSKGAFFRSSDPFDGRRAFISLAPEVQARMSALLQSYASRA